MQNKRIAIISIDGDLIDAIQNENTLTLVGVFDVKNSKQVRNVDWLGSDADWDEWHKKNSDVQVLMAVDQPDVRKKLLFQYGKCNVSGFCSKDAYVSPSAKIEAGVIVQRNVSISAGVRVSEYSKINMDATIHHDCVIGKYVTVAPGARLLGNVNINDEAYIGASAVILPGLVIGKGAVIGAGAVVTKSVQDYQTVVGCPAKPKK